MKKFKRIRRIFAWIGIVVLVGLYVTTLILAFSGSHMAQALFRGSFAATVVFPVLLYAMQIIYRILKPADTADALGMAIAHCHCSRSRLMGTSVRESVAFP